MLYTLKSLMDKQGNALAFKTTHHLLTYIYTNRDIDDFNLKNIAQELRVRSKKTTSSSSYVWKHPDIKDLSMFTSLLDVFDYSWKQTIQRKKDEANGVYTGWGSNIAVKSDLDILKEEFKIITDRLNTQIKVLNEKINMLL